jgi:methyltransferase (TIGR00027 family)
LHFGPIDFERESIAQALQRLPFRPDAPALFAWLGVTMYLTRAAIDNTLRAVREVAVPGSELVFDFIAASTISAASERMKKLRERTRAIGEEIITGIDPTCLAAELDASGWKLIEHLDGNEIHRRWFAARDDGYAPPRGHLACAGVV